MTARRLGVFPHDSPEWHEARRTRIGGSDVPSIIGCGFLSRDEMLAQKRGLTVDRKASDAMHRGNDAEPTIAAWLKRKARIEYDHAKLGTYVDVEHDWMAYNPDQFTLDGRLVEFKCPRTREGWGRGGSDQVPDGYRAQVTWGMGILELTETLFGVMATKPVVGRDGQPSSDFDFARYRVRFDAGLFAELKAEAALFYADMMASHDVSVTVDAAWYVDGCLDVSGVSGFAVGGHGASVTVNDLGEDDA
jgi:putative phage-type endonuclease